MTTQLTERYADAVAYAATAHAAPSVAPAPRAARAARTAPRPGRASSLQVRQRKGVLAQVPRGPVPRLAKGYRGTLPALPTPVTPAAQARGPA